MNNNSETKSLKDTIISKIKHGDIKKLPKVFFNFKNTLFLFAMIIVFGFLLFLISFIFFALQMSELWYLPMFGFRGVEILLGNFPWLLILLVIVFIILLEYFVSRFRFAYRQPLLYSSLIIIIIITTLSIVVRQTTLHQMIYDKTERGGFQVLKTLYNEYTKPNPTDYHPGSVVNLNKEGFTLELQNKSVIQVRVSTSTIIRRDFKLYPGGRLLIIGKIKNGVLEAENVDNAPPSGRP
jgi:hypothetical protein